MKKIIFLGLLTVGFILTGCVSNNSNKGNQNAHIDNKEVKQVMKDNKNPNEIKNLAVYLEQKIQEKRQKLSNINLNLKDNAIIYDSNCKLQYCDVNLLKSQLVMFKLNENITGIDINNLNDVKDVFVKNQLPLPGLFIKNLDNLDPQVKQIFEINGYKFKDGVYLPFFMWIAGKENICDDGLDNDGDGKIDEKDSDCIQVKVLYDSACTDPKCNIDNLITSLKNSIFALGYSIDKVDYQSEEGKKLYTEYAKKVTPYLPVAILKDFTLLEIPYSIAKNNPKAIGYINGNYVLSLGGIWDPIKKDIIINDGFQRGQLTKDQIKQILKQGYVKGNLDKAEIAWIEYSDLECPFCKRQHNSGNIEYILNKYGDKIVFVFRHFPLGFHKYAKPGARAVECIGKLTKDSNKVYEYIKNVYKDGLNSEKILIDNAKKMGVDEKKFKECLNSNEFDKKIDEEMNLGQSLFNISGTPGNVFINLKTGKYIVIPGAYPKEQFEKAIEELMKSK